jgi:hypothetical protein
MDADIFFHILDQYLQIFIFDENQKCRVIKIKGVCPIYMNMPSSSS